MEFSSQEHWSGWWPFPLLQGIFLTQGSNPHLLHLLHCWADSLPAQLLRNWSWTESLSLVISDEYLTHDRKFQLAKRLPRFGWKANQRLYLRTQMECSVCDVVDHTDTRTHTHRHTHAHTHTWKALARMAGWFLKVQWNSFWPKHSAESVCREVEMHRTNAGSCRDPSAVWAGEMFPSAWFPHIPISLTFSAGRMRTAIKGKNSGALHNVTILE